MGRKKFLRGLRYVAFVLILCEMLFMADKYKAYAAGSILEEIYVIDDVNSRFTPVISFTR